MCHSFKVTHMYYTPMQVLQTFAGTVGVSRLLYIYYTVCWISKEVKFLNCELTLFNILKRSYF